MLQKYNNYRCEYQNPEVVNEKEEEEEGKKNVCSKYRKTIEPYRVFHCIILINKS